jgi:hypothetical protein
MRLAFSHQTLKMRVNQSCSVFVIANNPNLNIARAFQIAASRSFVIPPLWIGLVVSISFLETPLRFSVDTISLASKLEIGYRVFHVLNAIEIFLALTTLASVGWATSTSKRTRIIAILISLILFVQTVLLYSVLDARTLAIINGETVGDAPFHQVYVFLELFKLAALVCLAGFQISDFQRNIINFPFTPRPDLENKESESND